MKKQNDWLAENLENSDFSISDFKQVGLDSSNTGMLTKMEYKNSQYIRNKFTDSDGKFNEVAFDNKYNEALKSYNQFVSAKQQDNIMDYFATDPFDFTRADRSKVKKNTVSFEKSNDPDQKLIGIEGINVTSTATKSPLEIAESQKVYNTEKGKFEDYSLNDISFFRHPLDYITNFGNTYVLARYDSDGSHRDSSGRLVKHKKNQYKYNDNGTYYIETLDGKSPIGKDIVSKFDYITPEDSALNSVDFFDSDDLEKSVTGSMVKTAVTLAPLLIPGVGVYYGSLLAARELTTTLPMLQDITVGWSLGMDDSKSLNKLAAFAGSLKQGQSSYAKENTVSFEGITNLLSDVVLQISQQQAIAKGVGKLLGTSKLLNTAKLKTAEDLQKFMSTSSAEGVGVEEAYAGINAANMEAIRSRLESLQKLSSTTSLAYMSLISNTDTYETMVKSGASKGEAAAVSWGSMLGMFAVDKFLGVGELFIEGKGDEFIKGARATLKEKADEFAKSYKPQVQVSAKGLKGAFLKGKSLGMEAYSSWKNGTSGVLQKAIGEGLEEVSEELSTDLVKGTYELMSGWGWTPTKNNDVGAFDNIVERYGMNFFGGFLGGGMMGGKEKWDNRNNPEIDKSLVQLIRNNKTDDLISQLNILKKNGKLGSTDLSATKIENTEDGEPVFLTATDDDDSQNTAVYNVLKNAINTIDGIVNTSGLKATDAELSAKAILTEVNTNRLQNSGFADLYINDANDLNIKILGLESEILKVTPNTDTALSTAKSDPNSLYSKTIKNNQPLIDELKIKRDEFFNGTNKFNYTKKLMFGINSVMSDPFFDSTFSQFVNTTKGVSLDKLSETEKEEVKSLWEKYKNKDRTQALNEAYSIFEKYNQDFANTAKNVNQLFESFSNDKQTLFDLLVDKNKTEELRNGLLSNDSENIVSQIFKNPYSMGKYVIKDSFKLDNITNDMSSEQKEITYQKNNEKLINLKNTLSETISRTGMIDSDISQIIKSIVNPVYDAYKEMLASSIGGLSSDKLTVNDLMKSKNMKSDLQKTYNEINSSLDKMTDEELISSFYDKFNNKPDEMPMRFIDDFSMPLSKNDAIQELQYGELNDNDRNFIEKLYKDNFLNTDLKKINDTINNVVPIFENEQYQYVNDILDTIKNTSKLNALQHALKNISINLYDSENNIINLLLSESDKVAALNDLSDYTLSDASLSEIEEAQNILKMVNSLLMATATPISPSSYQGFNNTLNELANKNSVEDFKELGTISSDAASALSNEVSDTIAQLEFYKRFAEINSINVFNEFKKTGHALEKTQYAFLTNEWMRNTGLLDGIDSIELFDDDSDNGTITLNKVKDLIYNNFQNKLKDSSVPQLLEDLKITDEFKIGDRQATSKLNSKLLTLTNYDKVILLLTTFGIKSSDKEALLKNNLSDINIPYAPLSVQEYCLSSMLLATTDPMYFDWFVENYNFNNKIDLSRIIFIDSIGGAGKTTAIVGNYIKMLKQLKPNIKIMSVAPEISQANKLQLSTNSEVTNDMDQFMIHILGEESYASLKNSVTSKRPGEFLKKRKHFKRSIFDLDYDKISNSIKIDEINKVVVIDEITHFPTPYLSVIQLWAKKNNISIIGLGDTNQNGANSGLSDMENIEPNITYTIRMPKISTSLRNTNINQQDNTVKLVSIQNELDDEIDKLSNYIGTNEVEKKQNEACNKINKLFNQYELTYCETDLLNGTKIVTEWNDNLMSKIGKDMTIGYICHKDSKLKEHLSSLGININFYTPYSVQGKEEDYFIIDTDLFLTKDMDTLQSIKRNLKNIYTMIGRSREGNIVIQHAGDVKISNRKTEYPARVPDKSTAIKSFKEDRISILEKEIPIGYSITTEIDDSKPEYNIQEKQLEEEPKSSTVEEVIPEIKEIIDLSKFEEKVSNEENPVNPDVVPDSSVKPILLPVSIPSDNEVEINNGLKSTETKSNDIPSTLNKDITKMPDNFKMIRGYSSWSRDSLNRDENGDIVIGNRDEENNFLNFNIFTSTPDWNNYKITENSFNKMIMAMSLLKQYIIQKNLNNNDSLSNILIKLSYLDIYIPNSILNGEPNYRIVFKKITDNLYTGLDIPKEPIPILEASYNQDGKTYTIELAALTTPSTREKGGGIDNERYTNWYNKGVENLSSQDISKDDIEWSGLTYLMKNKKPKSLSDIRNDKSISVSRKIYIYTGKKENETDIIPFKEDNDLSGRPFVFVSSDTSIMEEDDELLNRYIDQVKNKSTNTNSFTSPDGKVRAVPLNVKGISISDFYGSKSINLRNQNNGRFPTSIAYTSARMYGSMWDYRAKLFHLLDKVREFEIEKHNSDESFPITIPTELTSLNTNEILGLASSNLFKNSKLLDEFDQFLNTKSNLTQGTSRFFFQSNKGAPTQYLKYGIRILSENENNSFGKTSPIYAGTLNNEIQYAMIQNKKGSSTVAYANYLDPNTIVYQLAILNNIFKTTEHFFSLGDISPTSFLDYSNEDGEKIYRSIASAFMNSNSIIEGVDVNGNKVKKKMYKSFGAQCFLTIISELENSLAYGSISEHSRIKDPETNETFDMTPYLKPFLEIHGNINIQNILSKFKYDIPMDSNLSDLTYQHYNMLSNSLKQILHGTHLYGMEGVHQRTGTYFPEGMFIHPKIDRDDKNGLRLFMPAEEMQSGYFEVGVDILSPLIHLKPNVFTNDVSRTESTKNINEIENIEENKIDKVFSEIINFINNNNDIFLSDKEKNDVLNKLSKNDLETFNNGVFSLSLQNNNLIYTFVKNANDEIKYSINSINKINPEKDIESIEENNDDTSSKEELLNNVFNEYAESLNDSEIYNILLEMYGLKENDLLLSTADSLIENDITGIEKEFINNIINVLGKDEIEISKNSRCSL